MVGWMLNRGLERRRTLVLWFAIIGMWAATVFFPVPSEAAAPYVVDSYADIADANPGDGVCASMGISKCTLRAAVMEANAAGGADTIILPTGTYTLALAGTGENAAATGDLDITGDLTIIGANGNQDGDRAATIIEAGSVSKGGIDRVFQVNPEGTGTVNAAFKALTIRNGNVTGSSSVGSGGGIEFETANGLGSLLLYNVIVTENKAAGTGSGGGVDLFNGSTTTPAVVTIEKSVISNNETAQGDGGGILADQINLTIRDSAISGNVAKHPSANSLGGGLNVIGSTSQITIERSLFSNNQVNGTGDGGGIRTVTASLSISNSTFSGNNAGSDGGAIDFGGSKNLSLTNVTITGNTASLGNGGGINLLSTGTKTIQNSLIYGNTAMTNSEINGAMNTGNNNLVGSSGTGGLTNGINGNLVGVNPNLEALADNGGLTHTHKLLPGSPAIDAGNNAYVVGAYDQRGQARLLDGTGDAIETVDIGAFETVGLYKVTFNKNGGDTEATPTTKTAMLGGNVGTLPSAPTRAHHTFVGWNTAANGTGDAFTEATPVTSNLTVYAQWEVVPTSTPEASAAAALAEDTLLSPVALSRNAADGAEVTHFKISNITGGKLYKNDGTTEIPNGGFITAAEGAALKFSLHADFVGNAGFDVQAAYDTSGTGISGAKNVSITVTEVNDPVTAVDDMLPAHDEDSGPWTISFAQLTANDSAGPANESGQTLTIAAVGGAVGGTVEISGTDVIFTPTENFSGEASFTYTVEDNGTTNGAAAAQSDTGTATFTVNPMAEAPSITPTTTAEDTQSSTGLQIAANAADGAAVTHFKITGIVGGKLYKSNGITEIQDGTYITAAEGAAGLRFTPSPNLNSPSDTFTFNVQASLDGSGTGISSQVSASITVTEVNDSVVAENDTWPAVDEDSGPWTISFVDLLGNDSVGPANESGQTMTITAVGAPVGGTVETLGTEVIFTPDLNFNGAASFTYTVQDNGTTNGAPAPSTSTATAAFTVNPIADIPTVSGTTIAEDELSTSLSITKNINDGIDVTHFRITEVTGGILYVEGAPLANGDYISLAEGATKLVFAPTPDKNSLAGNAFSFKVQAAMGQSLVRISDPLLVVITVNEVNDAPTANDETLNPVLEGVTEVVIPFTELTQNELSGPINESSQDLTVTSVTALQGGTVSIVGSNVVFVPSTNFHGTAKFTYTVTDNGTTNGSLDAKSGTATATLPIDPSAQAPSVTSATTDEDTQSTSGLVLTRNAVDGEEVTHFKITDIVGGKLYKNDGTTEIVNGSFISAAEGNAGLRFTPNADLNSPSGDAFGFKVQAAVGMSDAYASTAITATITVTEVNDAPVAEDDILGSIQSGSGSRTISIASLIANDKGGPANESGQTLTITAVTGAVNGTVSISGSDIIFTPAADFLGYVRFDYTIEDNGTNNGVLTPATDSATASFEIVLSDSLSQLAVRAGGLAQTLTPGFSPNVTAYSLTVGNSVSELSITPTAVSGAAAAIEVKGKVVASGSASDPIPLVVGTNTITISVSANGNPAKVYTLTVMRQSPPSSVKPEQPKQETRKANVVTDSTAENTVVQVDITRTTNQDGSIVDAVAFTEEKAEKIVEQAKTNNAKQAVIIVDDLPDAPASEITVNVPKNALSSLSVSKLDLVIQSGGVEITLPNDSLDSLSSGEEDLYFRVVPLREDEARQEVSKRVTSSDELIVYVQGKETRIVGVPMKIETNYSNQRTKLTLPLNASILPESPDELEAFLAGLAVFVEHSDGEKVVKQGTVKYDKNGNPVGYEIEITKFSTFSLINIENPNLHHKYMNGYPDGTFRPDHALTRAELAAMLYTLLGDQLAQASSGTGSYSDVNAGHWAYEAVQAMKANGLMIGDQRGRFNPNQWVSRAELSVIAARWLKLQAASGKAASFSDVSGHWAEQSIYAVQASGFMQGYSDGSFQPNRALTRSEAVKVLNQLAERPYPKDGEAIAWKDVPAAHWAKREIDSATTTFEAR